MKNFIAPHSKILMEGAIVEQLRHCFSYQLHPTLINAPLIYDERSCADLTNLYSSYIEIALDAGLPFLMCSPTWRTNYDRVKSSNINTSINRDAIKFMQTIRDFYPENKDQIKIGGLLGCKGDAYRPEEALSCAQAKRFHAWQANELAQAGADFIIAETLPSIEEAKGIAMALEETSLPYIISFVINRQGRILDGTSLSEAVASIDDSTYKNPVGYMINCSYPTFLCADKQPPEIFDRIIGFLANASSQDHCDLDGASELKSENVEDWAKTMLELNQKYKIKILGGCCGTTSEHLKFLSL